LKHSLVLLVILLGCCNASQLLALPAFNQLSQLIKGGYDVRGSYGQNPGFTLVVLDDVNSLFVADKSIISELNDYQMVLIVEDNGREISTQEFSFCNRFLTKVQCFNDACVMLFDVTKESDVLSCMPASLELVSMPTTSVHIPVQVEPIRIAPNPVITSLVNQVSIQTLTESLIALTNINTRQSQSAGAIEASNYLFSTYQKFGWNVTRNSFRAGYSDNIIAEIRGASVPSKIVIIGAHYDSRATNVNSVTDRAPGANDDGSGTAALIELARIFGLSGLKYPYTLRLGSWSGEEQGLYGSTAYANAQKAAGADIVAMLQADMISYQAPTNPVISMNFSTRSTTATFTDQLAAIAKEYVPTLTIGRTTACCSDQQPFFNNGYAAALFTEAASDPQYHQVGDVINRSGYNITLISSVTKSVLAGAATYALIG